jgi:CheY-like chemotaxis protein
MRQKAVWIVDDDPIYQIVVNKIIQRSEKFSVILSFKNGKEAIDHLYLTAESNVALPDIILLDINMPVMDGWEFMEQMDLLKCKFNKKIIVYIVSSSIAVEDKNKSKSHENILGYLSKPITVNDLLLISSDDEE